MAASRFWLRCLFSEAGCRQRVSGAVIREQACQNPTVSQSRDHKRSDQARGFVRSPERWIVERTIAWLNRCRGLAKDCENLNRNALAFLKLASIRFMLRKLYNELRVSAAASAAETLNSFLRSQALTGDLATDRFPGHGFAGASDGLSYWSGLPT